MEELAYAHNLLRANFRPENSTCKRQGKLFFPLFAFQIKIVYLLGPIDGQR
jgi:hypothetical protein